MNNRLLRDLFKLLSSLLLLAVSHTALAEEYWYSIEYILFEHRASAVHDQEPWSGNVSPIPEGAVDLIPVIASPEDWTSLRRLRSDEMSLGGTQRVVSRSVAYKVLDHAGWIQLVSEEIPSKPIRIQIDGLESQVTGTLTFRRSRFLHLDVDLTLIEPQGADVYRTYASERPDGILYRLHQTRRIRSEEINYFDHPRLGILIKVLPLTPPEPEPVLPLTETTQASEASTVNNPQPASETATPSTVKPETPTTTN